MSWNRFIRPASVAAFLFATVLTLGTAVAGNGVDWIDERFDAFEEDSGFVEIVRQGDSLALVLQEEQGSLPAEMSGDFLPLDDDFDSDLLDRQHSVSLYGGLAVETGVDWVVVQLEGDSGEIHDAILERLRGLGIRAEEDGMIGGPVRSYRLNHGDAAWRIAISLNGEGALVHLQAMY